MLKKNHNKIHDNNNKKGTTSPHPLPSRRRDLIYRGGQLPVPPRPPSPRLSRRGLRQLCAALLGSARFGTAQLDAARLGSAPSRRPSAAAAFTRGTAPARSPLPSLPEPLRQPRIGDPGPSREGKGELRGASSTQRGCPLATHLGVRATRGDGQGPQQSLPGLVIYTHIIYI